MCREWICKILFSYGLLKPICQLWDSTSANVHNGIISTLHGQVAVIVDHLHSRFAPDVLLGRKSHIILERYDAHKGGQNRSNLNCGQSWILYVKRAIGVRFILIQTKNNSLGTLAHMGKKPHRHSSLCLKRVSKIPNHIYSWRDWANLILTFIDRGFRKDCSSLIRIFVKYHLNLYIILISTCFWSFCG